MHTEEFALEAPDFLTAIDLALRHPDDIVQVFVGDWAAVDLLRAKVAAAGLGCRIAVHHTAARKLLARMHGPVPANRGESSSSRQTSNRSPRNPRRAAG